MNKLRNGRLPALTGLAIMVLLACACAESARLSPPATPKEPAPTPTYAPRTITGFWPDLEKSPAWIRLSNDYTNNNLKGEIQTADDRISQYEVTVHVNGVRWTNWKTAEPTHKESTFTWFELSGPTVPDHHSEATVTEVIIDGVVRDRLVCGKVNETSHSSVWACLNSIDHQKMKSNWQLTQPMQPDPKEKIIFVTPSAEYPSKPTPSAATEGEIIKPSKSQVESAPIWMRLSNNHPSGNLKGEVAAADDRIGLNDVSVRVEGERWTNRRTLEKRNPEPSVTWFELSGPETTVHHSEAAVTGAIISGTLQATLVCGKAYESTPHFSDFACKQTK